MSGPLESSTKIRSEQAKATIFRVPFEHIFLDALRINENPDPEKASYLFTKMLDCIPEELLPQLYIRGSTSLYAALQQQLDIHRRGTISFSLMTYLSDDLYQARNLPIAQALTQMSYAPNIDTFFKNVGEDEFKAITKNITARLSSFKEEKSSPVFNSLKKELDISLPQEDWLIGLNSPLCKKREWGKRKTHFVIKNRRTPGGVASMFASIIGQGKENIDTVPIGHLYLAADHEQYPEGFDTRKDSRYALSWDLCMGHLQKENGKYFIVFDEENMNRLYSPMTIGQDYHDLPASQRFLLALRATQKGAMSEELLQQSEEGRNALQTRHGLAPAIDPETLTRLNMEITPEELQKDLAAMTLDERRDYEAYVEQYMLTGLFYPQKFIEYAQATGIMRFFPNLSSIHSDQWGSLRMLLPEHNTYSQSQYRATHIGETNHSPGAGGFLNADNLIVHGETQANMDQFINPYQSFIEGLKQINLISVHLDPLTPFEVLDTLLALHDSGQSGQLREIDQPKSLPPNKQPPSPNHISLSEAERLYYKEHRIYIINKYIAISSFIAALVGDTYLLTYVAQHPEALMLLLNFWGITQSTLLISGAKASFAKLKRDHLDRMIKVAKGEIHLKKPAKG